MKRAIEIVLDQWVSDPQRKVLLLRGARQVGKTYSIRALGKKFGHYLEVNFESDKSVHHFFQSDLNPDEICANLSAYYNIPVLDGETLLFLDEIQSCIPAISSLRFFHEKRPGLHVVAAGSLLEFALNELPSFGVGRIQFLFMYPLSFAEFLIANQEQKLHEIVLNSNSLKPMNEVFHKRLLGYLKKFLFTGGLPEVVETFLSTNDLRQAQTVLDRLILGFDDDFGKYKKQVPAYRLKEVFQAVAAQSGNQFTFSRTSDNMSIEQIKVSLNLLEMAGLVYKVKHTSANGIPLGAGVNTKKFKIIMFDHGIFQRVLGLDLSQHLLADDFEAINKGYHAEQFAGTELIKYSNPQLKAQLYYWHREKSGSSAEVDYVIQKSGSVIPLEVKSGTQGKMQSLWMFMKEKNPGSGIRISLENFSHYQSIEVYPLYAIENIRMEI
ncbi:MAG: ATP-binding protein [Lentimicrobium sp.]